MATATPQGRLIRACRLGPRSQPALPSGCLVPAAGVVADAAALTSDQSMLHKRTWKAVAKCSCESCTAVPVVDEEVQGFPQVLCWRVATGAAALRLKARPGVRPDRCCGPSAHVCTLVQIPSERVGSGSTFIFKYLLSPSQSQTYVEGLQIRSSKGHGRHSSIARCWQHKRRMRTRKLWILRRRFQRHVVPGYGAALARDAGPEFFCKGAARVVEDRRQLPGRHRQLVPLDAHCMAHLGKDFTTHQALGQAGGVSHDGATWRR